MTDDQAAAMRRYRKAMAKLRPQRRGDRAELPEDPDADHVQPRAGAAGGPGADG